MKDPLELATGPDGALWFTNAGANSIGRITTSGVVSTFPGVPGTSPVDIAAGPDGALWFTTVGNTAANAVGRITTAGAVTSFTDPALSVGYPQGITTGADGALWLVDEWMLFRVATGGEITSFDVGSTHPTGITLGPDGALWFTGRATNVVGRAVLPPTAAPSGLSATALSRSQIGLSWTDNASNETGFRIERSWNGSTDWKQIATVAANVTAYTHSRQPAATTFHYRVRATNAAGSSAYSNVVLCDDARGFDAGPPTRPSGWAAWRRPRSGKGWGLVVTDRSNGQLVDDRMPL